ncbi:class IV adenylate cyclase [Glycomyces sp. YM15]|uniref:class IV adenylate cyclase n=1 Tax=Glycomyces sp. YM15 TaxID=2800446 RepID=UPI001964A0A8|nr:class IV adenylate cyclase [Glycomyces sp. YM15]
MIEAELKARVDKPARVRAALAALADAENATYRDTYFDWPSHQLDAEGTEVRLRTIETAAGARHLLTYKQPAVDASGSKPEHETTVAAPEPVAAMLTGLGMVILVALTKHCVNYRFDRAGRSMLATLVTVPELDGYFLEVETVCEPDAVDAALAEIRAVLEEFGLADRLDTSTYTGSVKAARAGEGTGKGASSAAGS